MRRALILACVLGLALPSAAREDVPPEPFSIALDLAERALQAKDLTEAARQIDRALERDAQSAQAWAVRARIAAAREDLDDRLYSLHRRLGLLVGQGAPKKDIAAAQEQLIALDPQSKLLLGMAKKYVGELLKLAKEYEKAKRPHAAIRTYQELLALAPDSVEAQEAIERISEAPDPSLAETAKPKDLLEGISEEWIRAHDAKHNTWDTRASLKGPNYHTFTDAGYAVLVRCSAAMDQMNAFYRQFFRYGYDDGKSVPRIALNIFRDRETYLEKGIGPPVEWSKGHFTGGAVETWIGDSGFDSMVTTLFHEAAHQFVSLSTNAVGWLNEGLACFFEGCRILPNGTVLVNRPANGRLFSLANRMSKGWMSSAADGIDPANASKSRPERAPTFRIIIENDYQWGPPWYAPTWGVAYFLYNFQDPLDGRFVYRTAFREFIDASGGKRGPKAVENFEKVVLAQPKPPTKTLPKDAKVLKDLPKTVEELDKVWRAWILALRDEQSGKSKTERPYLDWARYAIDRKDYEEASEHFEKGLVETPTDIDLLDAFAAHLAKRDRNKDRAAKLLLQALRILEAQTPLDAARVQDLERRLTKLDAQFVGVNRLHGKLFEEAHGIAKAYLDRNFNLMAMHVSWRLATDLRLTGLLPIFEEAVRRTGKSLSLWKLAYNEQDLRGWSTSGSKVFSPYGTILRSRFGVYEPGRADYTFLTLDTVMAGDFSLEGEVLAKPKECGFAGLVFGRKDGSSFHCVIFFPEGYVDLVSFYGAGIFKTWRHCPVKKTQKGDGDVWRKIRIDVSGATVDLWADGELIVSHDFPSRAVLRGSLGLITGPGTAQFRNIRYLSRAPGDLASAIERKIRMEKLEAAGKSTNGSYMGKVPPWPQHMGWIGPPAKSWFEKGYVPTLLTFWSMKQNDVMPIAPLLRHLEKQYADAGLRIISVVENADEETLKAYVKQCDFPGSIAMDDIDLGKRTYGKTMDTFFLGARFQYPRMLLMDIDQRVVWEGDPGLERGNPWKPGVATYIEDPLKDLVEKRALDKLPKWIQAWQDGGREDVQSGALQRRMELLKTARVLPAEVVPEVAHAQRMLGAIEAMLAALPDMVPQLKRKKAQPAFVVLDALAKALEVELGKKMAREIRSGMKSPRTRAWEIVLGRVTKAQKALDDGKDMAEALKPVLDKAVPGKGLFPGLLGEALKAALAANDAVAVKALLADAPETPGRWLTREFLHFK